MILSPNKYFPLSCDQGFIVDIGYSIFESEKKEHNIIISRVINRHMGSMYIETPCI